MMQARTAKSVHERCNMSTASPSVRRGPAASLAMRYALRQLRGGLGGFYVFIACIALGVMAIAGVGSVAASLGEGLAREGRTLLGGDVAFSLIQREGKPDEVAFLRSRGEVSVAASLTAMVRSGDGRLALVEVKAVDAAYPMLGELTLRPTMQLADLLAERDGAFGAAADSTLLARLDLKIGDRVSLGSASFQIRAVVDGEPDKLAGGLGLGPRFLVSQSGLRTTALLQPGSLVRWIYRLKLPDNATDDRAATTFINEVRSALPQAGWEIRSRSNASPQLERTISRFTQFLTLVGLASLLVGGVGVANAVKSHIDRSRDVVATLKALGATGRDVFTIYLTQVIVLAAIGSVIGLALGAALPFIIVGVFGNLLPLPVVPAFHPEELVMSLGLGLAVLVTITQIDGNLRRQFLAALPDRAPSFYFIDIPNSEADRFGALLKKIAPQSAVEDVPMLRGRIVAARGVRAEQLKPSTDSEWVLQSDRGLTYTGEIPKGSKVVEGQWWGADYEGPPLVSMEKKIADGLGVKI